MTDLRQDAALAEDSDDMSVAYQSENDELTNEELLKNIQNNELPYDAFSKLVRRNNKRFYILAYRMERIACQFSLTAFCRTRAALPLSR